jgi:dTDP-4-amino-4,6-dideoxygalactose transaminase
MLRTPNLLGGKVVPFLDLTRQYAKIKSEILSATQRVYEKGRFILGEEVSAFEREFSHYCGVRYGVGVGSGTDALYLALKAAGIGKGDEVITVANSFVATALAISFTGARPVFVDIDPKAYTMDPNSLELLLKREKTKKSGQKIRAVLPVHLFGHPADMDSIMEVANRYDLVVIEDACQAHGAKYGRKKTGSLGAMGCFSFYPTKNLGGYGDGGMVVTDDHPYDQKLRLLRCYGERKKYEHILKGHNSRLDEIQAAILRVKLKHLDQWNEERRRKAELYTKTLFPLGVECPSEKKGVRHVYHLYTIKTGKRDALQAFLKKRRIETLIHYPVSIPLEKAYQEMGYRRGDFPLAYQWSRKILSLPFFPEMKESEMEEVAEGIRFFIKNE